MNNEKHHDNASSKTTAQQSDIPPPIPNRFVHWGRGIILLWGIMYSVSAALLLRASVSPERGPLWLGIIDGLLAFILVFTMAAISRIARGTIAPQTLARSYQIGIYLPAVLFAALWVLRDHFDWNILFPGLAWRTWLILFILPAILGLWKTARTR